MPAVSVIIPTHNREAPCEKAIQAVLAQSFQDVEIIVVDDGSTDRTRERLAAAFGDRITYIHQENAGASVARNRGILEAKGEFIALLDSDDLFLPTHLEESVRFLNDFPEISFVFGDIEKFNDSGTVMASFLKGKAVSSIPSTRHPGGRVVFDRLVFTELIAGNFVPTSTFVIRRSCFAKAGIFDPGFRFLNDADLLLRVARFYRGGYFEKVMARYRIGNDNLTDGKWNEIRLRHKLKLLDKIAAAGLDAREREAADREYAVTCFDLGYALFRRAEGGEARSFLRRSLSGGHRMARSGILFLASFLPRSAPAAGKEKARP